MNLRKQLRDSLGGIIIAMLLGGSLALTLTNAMGLAPTIWNVALPCLITAVCATAMTLGIWPLICTMVLIAGGCAVSVYFKLTPYTAVRALIIALLTDGTLSDHADAIAAILGILLTGTSFLMTCVRGGVYPALIMMILAAMGSWIFGRTLNIYYIAPALIAVAMLFASSAREHTSFNSALPIALTAVITALLLMPFMGGVSSTLQQFGRTVRDTLGDYLMYSEARTLYSIHSDGYQSDSNQLGGDANPSDFPIMSVETDRTLLLRGTIKRDYTGSVWVDTSVNSRNLFISPLRRSLRNQVFGLDLPSDESISAAPKGLIETEEVTATFLSRGTSTLFTPHRLTHLSTGADMIAYFNSSGEVFITRTIRAGDTYTFTAQIPDTYSDDMDAYLTSLSGSGHSVVLDSYLELPDGISTDLYDLTYSIIRSCETAYEKARAIEDYLRANCRYTLTPGDVPESEDFVSYFVLNSKRGYCTYFASALGVMARIAGIPSRYVEGYIVKPDESGTTEVTGKDAHAWVELYFDGFGWLSFDPTPDEEPNDDPEPTPDGIEYQDDLTPTPTPTPTPTVNVPPEDTPVPSQQPEEQPSDVPTTMPSNEPLPPDTTDSGSPHAWLIALVLLLILIILILVIAVRLMISTPKHVAQRTRSSRDKLMVYYRAILTVLEVQGLVPTSGETPTAFASRLMELKLAAPSFAAFTEAVIKSRYAGVEVSPDMCQLGAAAYADAVKALRLNERFRWYRKRIRSGMGSVKHIP